jgi:hypothetical protein
MLNVNEYPWKVPDGRIDSGHLTPCAQGRREGEGQISPCPEVLGAPEIFLLGPSLFFWLNISAQRTRYLFFVDKYRNLA